MTNGYDGTVTKLQASNGACLGTCTFSVGGAEVGHVTATGVAFDGTYVWVVNDWLCTVTKLRASDGANFGVFRLPLSDAPLGAAFDGANIWVVYGPYGTGGAFKL